MKKLLLLLFVLYICNMNLSAQIENADGTVTFVSVPNKTNKKTNNATKTKYILDKGKKYPIYVTSKGTYFIYKVSKKSGKEYRCYLDSTTINNIKEYELRTTAR